MNYDWGIQKDYDNQATKDILGIDFKIPWQQTIVEMVESLIETGYIKEQRKKYKFDLTPQEVGWPSWIYDFSQDPPELWHLQDFTADLKYHDEGIINFAQWFRVLGILMCLSCFFTSFISFPLERFFFPFTNWTLIITTVSLILSYLASTDKHNFGPKAFHIKDK